MRTSEILKESNVMGEVGMTTSEPHQGHARSGAKTTCWIQGCLNPATTALSSAWYPDIQWIVCDECEWTVDLALGESCRHENSLQDDVPNFQQKQESSIILGSSLNLFKGSRCFPLHRTQEKTVLSREPSYNSIKNYFKIFDENAALGTMETWHQLDKVLSLRKLSSHRRNKKCDVEGCTLEACSLWSTWKRLENLESASRSRMYVCVDCQEKKFGGWPTLPYLLGKGYMTEEKLEIIASKCSKQQRPALPPALMKRLN